jgi:hypothetical protein
MSHQVVDLSELSLEGLLELRTMCTSGTVELDCANLRLLQDHIGRRKQIVHALEDTIVSETE